jgi:hypothetical protein
MATATLDFSDWLEQADIPARRLTPEVEALLRAVFRFRQEQGADYFSIRLLSHFLLHCHSGLKVAQIARLLGLGRQAASGHQGLSSKEAIQQAHHRLNGRPYGKLLPRYAGPIAAFLLGHPDSTRADLLGFIEATFAVRVSRIALYKFLNKYGLDCIAAPAQAPPATAQPAPPPAPVPAASPRPPQSSPPPVAAQASAEQPLVLLPGPDLVPALAPAGVPAPPFSSAGPSTPAPLC